MSTGQRSWAWPLPVAEYLSSWWLRRGAAPPRPKTPGADAPSAGLAFAGFAAVVDAPPAAPSAAPTHAVVSSAAFATGAPATAPPSEVHFEPPRTPRRAIATNSARVTRPLPPPPPPPLSSSSRATAATSAGASVAAATAASWLSKRATAVSQITTRSSRSPSSPFSTPHRRASTKPHGPHCVRPAIFNHLVGLEFKKRNGLRLEQRRLASCCGFGTSQKRGPPRGKTSQPANQKSGNAHSPALLLSGFCSSMIALPGFCGFDFVGCREAEPWKCGSGESKSAGGSGIPAFAMPLPHFCKKRTSWKCACPLLPRTFAFPPHRRFS